MWKTNKLIIFLLGLLFFNSAYAQSGKIVYGNFFLGNDSIPALAELNSYIGEKLNQTFVPVFERDRATAVKMIAFKEASFGFLCSGPYVIAKDTHNLEIIAAMKPSFGREYRGYIIVPLDSRASSLFDLKGKSFAFVDLQAYTGRLVALYMLVQKGFDPKTFFSELRQTRSHEASVYEVADKKVAGASVMSIVYDYLLTKDPSLAARVKIIEKSEKAGMPVFVASKHINPEFKEKVRKVLLGMEADKKGRAVLKKMQLDGFYVPKDEEYSLIKKQVDALKDLILQ